MPCIHSLHPAIRHLWAWFEDFWDYLVRNFWVTYTVLLVAWMLLVFTTA